MQFLGLAITVLNRGLGGGLPPPPSGSDYLRPGGVYSYRRPDGTSSYIRP